MHIKAEDLAFGRWPEILIRAGMDSSFFTGNNGPCPFCGGGDRYRWSKKHGGVWVCTYCTESKYASAFRMLMEHMGYRSFMEAANHVRDHFGATDQIEAIARKAKVSYDEGMTQERIAKNHQRMLRFWNEAREITPGDPVDLYMKNRCRGLTILPQNLRFHPGLEYWERPKVEGDKPTLLGKFPAMLAYAQDATGSLVQLHKTFLTPDGQKNTCVPEAKKTDYGVGSNSFAIRMMPLTGDTIGVCEGIETGWGSAMLKNIPVWPCLNGSVMSNFEIPEEYREQVRRVVIFEDFDLLKQCGSVDGKPKMRRAGSFYAEKLAERVRSQGKKVLIIKPFREGYDMADQWNTMSANT